MKKHKIRIFAAAAVMMMILSVMPVFAESSGPARNMSAGPQTDGQTARLTLSYAPGSSSPKAVPGGIGTKTGNAAAKNTASYKNVTKAYSLFNRFRTTRKNQWYWNSSNTKKIRTYGLKALKRDASLEKVARKRAREQWIQYYKNGKITHVRPNGKPGSTAFPAGFRYIGENLGWGHTSCSSIILDPIYGWAETQMKYSGQGHRRNMLNRHFTRVGIACYVKNGRTCWAMCLAK